MTENAQNSKPPFFAYKKQFPGIENFRHIVILNFSAGIIPMRKDDSMKHYLWLEEKNARDFLCPWRDEACIGNRCMAWLPDEDYGHLGRCALVPSVDE